MVHASFSCQGLQASSQIGHIVVFAITPVQISLFWMNWSIFDNDIDGGMGCCSYVDVISVETVVKPYIRQKMPTWIANINSYIIIQMYHHSSKRYETNQAGGYEHNSIVAKPSKVKGHLNPIIVPENESKCYCMKVKVMIKWNKRPPQPHNSS